MSTGALSRSLFASRFRLMLYVLVALTGAVRIADRPLSAQTSPIQTVFVITFENTNWSNIVSSPSAPYINSILSKASHAAQYYTPPGIHPSTPNYLWLEAGQDFGLAGLSGFTPALYSQTTTNHLTTQLTNANISWKTYQESMIPGSCPLTDEGQYAVRHNPFVFFSDITNSNDPNSATCTAHVRPYSDLASDLAQNTVVRYNFITPNVCDDMHDCGISAGDTWLASELPKILSSQAYLNGGVVFITWDEGTNDSDGPIGLIALSPVAKGGGYTNSLYYTHSSLLLTLQEIFGVRPLLGDAPNATDLSDLFATFPAVVPSTPTPVDSSAGISTNLTLRWSSSGASDTVRFGTANPPPTVAVNVATRSYTPSALTVSTTYYWQVVSSTAAGTTTSPVWKFTTGSGGSPTLPAPWISQDIGATGQTGSATFNGGIFTVLGAGASIWGTNDSFQYVNQPVTGDVTIVARAESLENTSTYAKAGIMLRESTSPTAANVVLDLRPTGDFEFMTRAVTGGNETFLATAHIPFPAWIRLVRSGASVTASVSSDSVAWTALGSTSFASSTSLAGLIVCSATPGTRATATFDSVAVTTPAPTPPATPGSPNPANAASGVTVTPMLTWSAVGGTSYDVRFGTNPTPSIVSSGQLAASYSPPALVAGTMYFWQVVAHNSSGTTAGPVWSFTTAAAASPANDVVIYASDIPAGSIHGLWTPTNDPTAANGLKLATAATGWSTVGAPLASPTDYVDVTFNANAGTPYTLWLRLQATGNSKGSDSVWVQFSDAQAGGSAVYPINSTAGLLVKLASDSSGASDNAWGWVNSAYWLSQATTVTFPTTGPHTMRIQIRYAGVQFDQIVLSPTTYFNASASCPNSCAGAPGPITNDHTIVPKPAPPASPASPPPTAPSTPNTPSPANAAAGVTALPTLMWSAAGATSYSVYFGAANPPPLAAAGLTAASHTPGSLAAGTPYFWQVVATNSGGSTAGPIWSFTTAPANVVIYASDVPSANIHGLWAVTSDPTSPNQIKLATPANGWSTANAPLASPIDYVDVSFTATANTPHTLWLRLRATNNSKASDSLWVQFSNAWANGAQVYPIGSSSGLLVKLASDSTASSDNAWGWVDGAYWLSQAATVTFPTTAQTLRIQVRYEGVQLDQIVLSPSTFFNASASCPISCAGAPGPITNDHTIVPKP